MGLELAANALLRIHTDTQFVEVEAIPAAAAGAAHDWSHGDVAERERRGEIVLRERERAGSRDAILPREAQPYRAPTEYSNQPNGFVIVWPFWVEAVNKQRSGILCYLLVYVSRGRVVYVRPF